MIVSQPPVDLSSIGEAVGSAAIVASRLCKKCLLNNSSIFSAEVRGILLALDMIHMSTGSQLLFLSDSLSCLQSLKKSTPHNFSWLRFYVACRPTCRRSSRTMNQADDWPLLIDFYFTHHALNSYALQELLASMFWWCGTLYPSTIDRLSHCLLINVF